jgi:hypothetical protein
LFECYCPGPVELEQSQEPADDLDRFPAIGHQIAKRRPLAYSARFQQRHQVTDLLGHRHTHLMQVLGTHGRHRAGRERRRRDLRERIGIHPDHDFGQKFLVALIERHRPRVAAQRGGLEFGEHLGDMLERAVLQ